MICCLVSYKGGSALNQRWWVETHGNFAVCGQWIWQKQAPVSMKPLSAWSKILHVKSLWRRMQEFSKAASTRGLSGNLARHFSFKNIEPAYFVISKSPPAPSYSMWTDFLLLISFQQFLWDLSLIKLISPTTLELKESWCQLHFWSKVISYSLLGFYQKDYTSSAVMFAIIGTQILPL